MMPKHTITSSALSGAPLGTARAGMLMPSCGWGALGTFGSSSWLPAPACSNQQKQHAQVLSLLCAHAAIVCVHMHVCAQASHSCCTSVKL